jgi:hypothetical protein
MASQIWKWTSTCEHTQGKGVSYLLGSCLEHGSLVQIFKVLDGVDIPNLPFSPDMVGRDAGIRLGRVIYMYDGVGLTQHW